MRGRATAVAIAAGLVASAGSAAAFDGNLDPGFDGPGGAGNGKFTVQVSAEQDQGQAVAVQPDGKIVVAGFADLDPGPSGDIDSVVLRYNPDGTLDPSFDGDPPSPGNGIVVTKVAGSEEDEALGVALAADGDIVVTGYADADPTASENLDFAVLRYQGDDGTLDPAFGGGDGIVTTPVATGASLDDFGEDIAIQPADGKIVVTGESHMGATDYDFTVLRYNGADGTLDAGFDGDGGSGNGIVTTDFDSEYNVPVSVALQGDGKIVVAGETGVPGPEPDDFGLARYNGADGTLDSSFDGPGGAGNGKFSLGFGAGLTDHATEVAIAPGGKLVVAGTNLAGGGGNLAVARLSQANGALDPSFDGDSGAGNGRVIASLSPGDGNEIYRGLAVRSDGAIVFGGFVDVDPGMTLNNDFAVGRLTPSGRLDDSFAGDGARTDPLEPTPGLDVINDLALSGERIIATGYSGPDPIGRDQALAAYLPDTDDPSTRITRKPRRRTRDRTPTFRFASDEPQSTFLCKVDRRPFKPCTSPRTLKRLRFGRHSFKVRAIDAVGNEDESAAKRRFRVIRP